MPTGNEIYTLRGRVVRIWHPEKPPMYLRDNKALRKEAQGKYIVRIEDPCMPAKGWWKRLVYRYKHEFEKTLEHDIFMSICPYLIGDVVELSAVKVLIPSGFFTRENRPNITQATPPKSTNPTEQKSFTGFVADYEYIKAFERIKIPDTFLGGSISWFIRTMTPIDEELVHIIKSDLRLEVIDGMTKNADGSINPDRLIQDTQAYKKNKDKLKVLIKSWDVYVSFGGKHTEAEHKQFKDDTREIDDIAQQIHDEILNKYHALTQIHLYNGRKS